jgi:type II secretory pathway pseudopilin PulG
MKRLSKYLSNTRDQAKRVSCQIQEGFSVVEIILAAALFLIFSGGAVFVVLQGFDANRTGSEQVVANSYAAEGIEAVRSIGDESYTNVATTSGWITGVGATGGVSSIWYFKGNGTSDLFGKYTRKITISTVQRNSNGDIVTSGTVDPNTMQVISTVSWNVTPARSDQVSQATYLTNWQQPAL